MGYRYSGGTGKIGMDLYGAVMHQRESMMEDTIETDRIRCRME